MPRIRSNDVTSVITGTWGPVNASGGFTEPHVETASLLDLDTMTDEVIPGFRRKSKAGHVFINPMEKIRTSHLWQPVNKYWSKKANGTGEHGGVGQVWNLPLQPQDPRLPSGLFNRPEFISAYDACVSTAVTEAYSNVGKSDAESLVSLGELRETLAFLASPIRAVKSLTERFNRYYDLLKRDREVYERRLKLFNQLPERLRKNRDKPELPKRQLKLGKLEASDISSLWLAYRYGLMPLVYDIQDHLKAFSNLGKKPPERQTARGKNERKVTYTAPPDLSSSEGSNYGVNRTTDFIIRARAGVLYVPRIEGIPEKFGLGLDRLPSALWEWVPLSFVADWFLNMSEFIDAMSAHLRAKEVLGAWVTTTVEYSHQSDFFFTPKFGGVSGSGSYTQFCTLKRRRSVTLADISLNVRIELNSKRIADAFALVHTLLVSTLKRK